MAMEQEKFDERWLRTNFGNVSTVTKDGASVSAARRLFNIQPYVPRDRNFRTRLHTAVNPNFILTPVEARDATAYLSVLKLAKEICDSRELRSSDFLKYMNAFNMLLRVVFGMDRPLVQDMVLYHPKRGQDPDQVIKYGEPMRPVYNEDPEHEHGSAHLIDFVDFSIHPRTAEVRKATLDDGYNHGHFLIE
jgi:hypothetical protein